MAYKMEKTTWCLLFYQFADKSNHLINLAAINFSNRLINIIPHVNLVADHIYNADETGLNY